MKAACKGIEGRGEEMGGERGMPGYKTREHHAGNHHVLPADEADVMWVFGFLAGRSCPSPR